MADQLPLLMFEIISSLSMRPSLFIGVDHGATSCSNYGACVLMPAVIGDDD